MEPTNIFLDEDYKKKTIDELGKESLLNFDFIELYKNNEKPIKNNPLLTGKDNKTMSDKFNQAIKNPFSLYSERDGMILGIETRLSEKSLPNVESFKNIATNSSIRLFDIGITNKKGSFPSHLSSSVGLIVKTFSNELLIYNNETLSPQNSHLEYIDRFKEDKTEFLNKINENHQIVKNNIFELLEQNHDVNIIYVEKGVGVIAHIVDFYNSRCHIQYLRNDDIEDLDITTLPNKVICLDCTAVKEPHLILKSNFQNKKLIIIVDIHHFSLINKIADFQHNSIVESEIDLSVLPSEVEFKKRAWELKEEKGIKLTAALNELSKQYGYSCFNAIKPKLVKN